MTFSKILKLLPVQKKKKIHLHSSFNTVFGWVVDCWHFAKMVAMVVVVLDFDRTIIDDDSDRWV